MTGLPYYKTTGRRQLNQNVTYYVSKSGNDLNDGLTPSTAFLTFERLLDQLLWIDGHWSSVTVQIGAGTWDEQLYLDERTIINVLEIQGSGPDTIIRHTIYVQNFTQLFLRNFKLKDINGSGLNVYDGASIYLDGGISIENCGYGILNNKSLVSINNSLTFIGLFEICFHVFGQTHINTPSAVNFQDVSVSNNVLAVGGGGLFICAGVPMTGSTTGSRATAYLGGIIDTAGYGIGIIPGSGNYSTQTGGALY
jgi:hypothetical protein